MKAFKAYIKKEYPHINSGDEMFAWDIWRAALEFALSQEIKKPLLGGSKHKHIDSIVLRNELEEE